MAILSLAMVAADAASAQDARAQAGIVGKTPRSFSTGVLDLLSYSVVPDAAASAVQINRGGHGDDDLGVTLVQLGGGFTWSERTPLYLEGYLGYGHYDPSFVFSDGDTLQGFPTRWNQAAMTVGAGYDIRLAENLYLRPIVNAAIARVTTHASLLGNLVAFPDDRDLAFLRHGQLNAWGLGGSLVLAYYDHLPAREIDIELRTTNFHLQTFGDTSPAVRGDTVAGAVNAWGRLRWPTGYEAFDRPVRWVIEGQYSRFLGGPHAALGFEYLTTLGGGLELDVGALDIGALGLYTQRLRLIGRYVFGVNVSGFSLGIGVSF